MEEHVQKLCNSIANVARELLEKDGHIKPIAFVGNFAESKLHVVDFDENFMHNDGAKDQLAIMLKGIVKQLNASFIMLVTDAWVCSIHKDDPINVELLLSKYGRVSNFPDEYKKESVVISYEDKSSCYSCVVHTEQILGKKTFGTAKFEKIEAAGRFTGLLAEN